MKLLPALLPSIPRLKLPCPPGSAWTLASWTARKTEMNSPSPAMILGRRPIFDSSSSRRCSAHLHTLSRRARCGVINSRCVIQPTCTSTVAVVLRGKLFKLGSTTQGIENCMGMQKYRMIFHIFWSCFVCCMVGASCRPGGLLVAFTMLQRCV